MGFGKKIKKHFRKQVRNFSKSFNLSSGKRSILNPLTHGAFSAKAVLKGLRHGAWKANAAKYVYGARRSAGTDLAFDIPVINSGGYAHNARTLSQLAGGR